ncbi:DUF4419 domain-containing protein [Catellatospora paridis]|uniref:DUF4419 domain-containing protein n=1 Tax=Catellatospora paridis TaxID=1617086 RepID=UPI0012D3FB57|nr:DUF4419 domain-containing protein [Catellatospora paridis]
MITFPVDDVTPAAEPLPTAPVGGLFPDALAFGGDPARPVLAPDGVHPLLSAIAHAFIDHRPLVLSPDAVWLTIAAGIAQHMRLHADELRPQLVRHPGRKIANVVHDGPIPADADSWQHLVEQWSKLLDGEIADAALFACDFSTSTEVERTAGRVVLLDAYSPRFVYWLTCVCGIPSITLTGTVEDWQLIRDRVDVIAGYGLENWCRSLRPILDQFVGAASGDVDTAFWQAVYNPVYAYGGDVITGWATRFYPYLAGHAPNPMLDLPIDEPRGRPGGGYDGPGITSRIVPAAMSHVTIRVNDRVTGDNRAVALHAGLVGVAQDADGALSPVAGWYLTPATIKIDDVIDRMVRDHETTPPAEINRETTDPEILALYSRIGSASLFGGAWRLLPAVDTWWRLNVNEIARVGDGDVYLLRMIDLADGRCIAAALDLGQSAAVAWVCCRVTAPPDGDGLAAPARALLDDPADVPVYGSSLAILLEAALDNGGDISHLEVGRLSGFARGGD